MEKYIPNTTTLTWGCALVGVAGTIWSVVTRHREKEKDDHFEKLDLFGQVRIDKLTPVSHTVHACAVDEFEYDFTSSNPFNWDLETFTIAESPGLIHQSKAAKDHHRHESVSHKHVRMEEMLLDEPEAEADAEADAEGELELDDKLHIGLPDSEDESDEFVLDEEMCMHLGRIDSVGLQARTTPFSSYWDTALGSSSVGVRPLGMKRSHTQVFRERKERKSVSSSTSSSLISSSSPVLSISSPDTKPCCNKGRFVCQVCSASFEVKSYLTRHLKKHKADKPYRCPFYASQQKGASANHRGTKCHPTGGFTRRDTFKTHLKALHFIYPTGTKSGSRCNVPGRCAGCFKEFGSNTDWLAHHIETNECPAMVSRYK